MLLVDSCHDIMLDPGLGSLVEGANESVRSRFTLLRQILDHRPDLIF
jgi:hypothetical protein